MVEKSLSIVVPIYNARPYLARCLEALARSIAPGDEIIVVADGESDGAWTLAEGFGARVVSLPARSGAAKARNAGAEVAKGDVLVFIDADVLVRPDTLARMRAAFSAEGAPDAIFGSYDDAPEEPDLLSQYRNLLHHYVHQTAREDATTFFSACGALPRALFLSIGGFRPIAMEDIDLGYRLTQGGRKIRLDHALLVKHLKRWRPWSLVRTDTIDRAMAWTLLLLEHPQHLRGDLNLRPEGRVSLLLVALLVASLLLSPLDARLLALAAGALAGLVAANRRLYGFFLEKRGLPFVLGAIPWHVVYFLCGGAGLVLGIAAHLARRWR